MCRGAEHMPRSSQHSRRSEATPPQGVRPIQTWEAQYPDTWILLEITEEDEGEPMQGRLLATADDPGELQEVWQAARAKGVLTMLTYGPPREPHPQAVMIARCSSKDDQSVPQTSSTIAGFSGGRAPRPPGRGGRMTLTIELTPIEEAQLTAAVRQAGLDPAELARQLVTTHLPPATPATPEDPTLALFAQWDADDAQMTPEDIAEAQRDYAVFTQRINAERARAGARILYP